MSWMRKLPILLCAAALATAVAAQNPPPPPPAAPVYPAPPPAAEEETPLNPYLAEKSYEIGMHYLKWKNYDAAISRFQEAIKHKPDHARAHMRLGEAHEKKGELKEAVKYYKKFLEILPNAPEAKNVKKKLAKLEAKLPKNNGSSLLRFALPAASAG